ncbi:hypothetical protein B0H11DRAFT_1945766 [Mycena galericulata]|nr:hypothetical protein B0H11DRAFT_1945766 [Mycena galericulata]
MFPDPFSLRRVETRRESTGIFSTPKNDINTPTSAKKYRFARRLATLLPLHIRTSSRTRSLQRQLHATVTVSDEARDIAPPRLYSAMSGGTVTLAAATPYSSATIPNTATIPVITHATSTITLTQIPAVHFADSSIDPSMYPSAPYTHSILHETNVRMESMPPADAALEINGLAHEIEGMFTEQAFVPVEQPLRCQTAESAFVHSSQSISDEEHEHQYTPVSADSNTSLRHHIWQVIYPSDMEWSNQLLRESTSARLTTTTQHRAYHQFHPTVASVNDDDSLSVTTKLAKDTKGLLLFEIDIELPYRAVEGTVFRCEGALRGPWTFVVVRYYQEGYAYIWCTNHLNKQQTLFRIAEHQVYDPEMDSVHVCCSSDCDQKRRFLARFM